MLEWVYWAGDRVEELARSDRDYREFAASRAALAPGFERLLETLSEENRELLLEYMMTVENMEYRKAQLAYEFGKQIGRKQVEK